MATSTIEHFLVSHPLFKESVKIGLLEFKEIPDSMDVGLHILCKVCGLHLCLSVGGLRTHIPTVVHPFEASVARNRSKPI